MNRLQTAGALILIAGIQFVIAAHIAESTYPGYSINQNYLSDLGATVRYTDVGVTTVIQQPASLIFTLTVLAIGVLVTLAAYLIFPLAKSKRPVVFMGLFGIGALGIAIFSEVFYTVHAIFTLTAFFFGGLAAIFSFKFEKRPMGYVSLILGIIALIAIPVMQLSNLHQIGQEFGITGLPSLYTPLGRGGMERMIAYPIILWLVIFGASLIAVPELAAKSIEATAHSS